MKNWLSPVLWLLLTFQLLWHVEWATFTGSGFEIAQSGPSPSTSLFLLLQGFLPLRPTDFTSPGYPAVGMDCQYCDYLGVVKWAFFCIDLLWYSSKLLLQYSCFVVWVLTHGPDTSIFAELSLISSIAEIKLSVFPHLAVFLSFLHWMQRSLSYSLAPFNLWHLRKCGISLSSFFSCFASSSFSLVKGLFCTTILFTFLS